MLGMLRRHDPDAHAFDACTCSGCTERRYQRAIAATDAAERARLEAEAAERFAAARQLRLPMSPLPHVAHCPDRLQRAPSVPCQPELL